MDYYTQFLSKAINNIHQDFFNVITSCGDKTEVIVRERVFCYEFYHQMRLIQKNYELDRYILSGEIDKRGHNEIELQRNPDFVLHNYGTNENNLIIIEVKIRFDRDEIKNDFETLTTYVDKYSYRKGCFVLVNYTMQYFIEQYLLRLNNEGINNLNKNADDIFILAKKDSFSKIEIETLKDLLLKTAYELN
ncbi:hypothetical protein ACFFGV_10025 [Pontibacillus salicampi]|uniref:GxxExxY protein n=1 Tax=Pontibacillus salicampi TaxID=1449801 RepID=A0ABV6LNI1_9BACI